MMPSDEEARAAVRTLIQWIGDDPTREGLLQTPDRVLRAWRESWGRGYSETNFEVTCFGNDGDDQMIMSRQISFSSYCEHHLALFSGTAAVAYIPRGQIVGISKLSRIVEHFSARLQVQERLTTNIADFIAMHVSPDCAVRMEAVHSCMTTRGVKQPHSSMVTTSLRGLFKEDPSTQEEFLAEARR